MDQNIRIAVCAAITASFTTGFAWGYKRAVRNLEVKYADQAEAEAQDWKAYYEKKAAELREEYDSELIQANNDNLKYAAAAERAEEALRTYQGEQEFLNSALEIEKRSDDEAQAIPESVVNEFVQDNVVTPEEYQRDDFGPRASMPVPVDAAVETLPKYTPDPANSPSPFQKPQHARREPTSVVDKTKPYVVSADEALNNEAEYAESTLTYYVGDAILTGENEEPLDDKSKLLLVGTNLPDTFGQLSGDENVVYIRNDRIRMYLEVVRNEGTYAAAAGLGDHE